jgi:predicted RNA-binding Zn-ribbon protein involved in translation (DUF1610 family)
MICKNCNTTIADIAKFCPKCGAKAEKTESIEETIQCPTCGIAYPKATKFCKKDGTPLQKVSPSVNEIKKSEATKKEIKPEAIFESELKAPTEVKTEDKPPEPEAVIEPKVSLEEKPPEKIPELEKPKDVIICPKCGIENPLTAKFCRKDGIPLKKEIKPPVTVEKEIKPEAAFRSKAELTPKVRVKEEPSKTWIWIAICGLFLIIAGAGSYLYFSGQIGKKPAEVTAVPEVTKPPEPPKAPEEVKKPLVPQKPETKTVLPPAPAKPAKPSVDIARIERDLNRTLRNRGLGDVYAEVNEDLIATLKGTVNDPRDKMLASNITESFKEIKGVKNEIRVAKLPPPPPPPVRPAEPPAPAPAPVPLPAPAPPPIVKIDPAKLEGNINRALRNGGIRGVTAEVNDNLEVTLRGSVMSQHEKDRAFEIAKGFKEAKRIRDVIFVVEQ